MSTLQENLDAILLDKNTNLLPENLKAGVNCLGVNGTLNNVDTSDATAMADDIINPKTAYVQGEKITGNIGLIEKASSDTVYHTKVIKTGFYSPTYYDAYAVGNITMFVYVYNSNLTCVVMKNDTLLLEQSFAISEVFSFSTVQALALNLVSNTTSQITFDVGIAYRNGSVYQYSFNTLTINPLNDSLTLGTKISTSFSGASGNDNTLWSIKTKPGRFVSIVKYNSDDYFLYVTTDWSTKKATVTYASLYHGYDYNPNAKITGNYKWLIQPKYAEYLDTNTTAIKSYGNAAGINDVYISPGNNYMFVGNVLYKITPSTNYTTMYNSRIKIADIIASTAFFTENEEYLYVRATSSINIYKLTTNTATLVQTFPYTNHTLAYIYGTASFLVFDGANTELVLFHVSTSTLTVEGLIRQGQNFIKLTRLDVPNTSEVLKDVEYKDQNGNKIVGTMPNNGELNYAPSSQPQTIPEGYTSGGNIPAYPINTNEYKGSLMLANKILTTVSKDVVEIDGKYYILPEECTEYYIVTKWKGKLCLLYGNTPYWGVYHNPPTTIFNYQSNNGYGTSSSRANFTQLVYSLDNFTGFNSPEQSYTDTWVHLGDAAIGTEVKILASSVDIHKSSNSIFYSKDDTSFDEENCLIYSTLKKINDNKTANLIPENIKAGVTILGVTGTYTG